MPALLISVCCFPSFPTAISNAALLGGHQRGLTSLMTVFCTQMSTMQESKNQDFPLSQADELHNTGTRTYWTGKFESSCSCFPKQIIKEYSALKSEQPNYAFYRILIYESADHKLEGQTFFPPQPLVIQSGEPKKNLLKFPLVLSGKKKKKKQGLKKNNKETATMKPANTEIQTGRSKDPKCQSKPCLLLRGGA